MNMLTDPDAPHRPADPHTAEETNLMRGALASAAIAPSPSSGRRHEDPLTRLIPDEPLSADIRRAVEYITGRPLRGPRLPSSDGYGAPSPAGARAALRRWGTRWNHYLAS